MASSIKLPLADGEERLSCCGELLAMGKKLEEAVTISGKLPLEEGMGKGKRRPVVAELEDEEEFKDEELTEQIIARDFRVSWEHRFSPRYSFHDTSKPFNFLSSFFQLLPPQSTSTRDCFCKSIYLCPLIMFRIAIIFYTHTHTPLARILAGSCSINILFSFILGSTDWHLVCETSVSVS